ncbi:MAG: ABC transporter permease [Actinobacteria bacterium]|nr:ABC transporter permease [Actinomycetota bacterium]
MEQRAAPARWFGLAVAPAAIVVTFVLTLGFVLAAGASPVEAYNQFLVEPLTSRFTALEVLVAATPLLVTGAAVAIAFRSGYWNIGAEGQLLLGAVAATWAATAFVGGLPRGLAIPLVIGLGALGGAVWALVPALLRVRLGIDEVVTTLLLNPVALLVVTGLLNGPWRNPETMFPESERIATSAELPPIAGVESRLHLGFVIAIALIVVAWFVFGRTATGLRLRAAGLSPEAAGFAGIRVGPLLLGAALVSGAIAGIAGASEVMGIQYRLTDGFSAGFGYTGIVVATLGGLSMPGVVLASLFLGDLVVGSTSAGRELGVPSQLADIVQGALLLVMVSLLLLRRHRVSFRRATT